MLQSMPPDPVAPLAPLEYISVTMSILAKTLDTTSTTITTTTMAPKPSEQRCRELRRQLHATLAEHRANEARSSGQIFRARGQAMRHELGLRRAAAAAAADQCAGITIHIYDADHFVVAGLNVLVCLLPDQPLHTQPSRFPQRGAR